jgi:hypothetical protein
LIRDPADHDATVGMSTENNIGKIFKLNETDNILDMSCQVNACIQEVMPLGLPSCIPCAYFFGEYLAACAPSASSTARFKTRSASWTSLGSPQIPLPVSRIALHKSVFSRTPSLKTLRLS